ncbi:MAG TPA: CoA transferase, partial [Myxococcales bacterium]|nr:CoA transferase [Myxococcales bacterium]
LEDPRFQNTAGLVAHAAERLEMMAEVLKTRTTEHWLEVLDEADVPCAPVLTRDNVHLNSQVQANGIIVEQEHPVVGLVRQARPAEQMDVTPSAISGPAPTLGQHTEEVLLEMGLSHERISELRESGVLGES